MIAPGARVAVVAPAGVHQPARFEQGVQMARALGLELVVPPHLLRPHRYLAAPDEARRAGLLAAFHDPSVSAIWAARGGYGVTRLLDGIDFGALPCKPVIGFSDLTALFCALRAAGNPSPCVHGPVVHSLPITAPASIAQLAGLLFGEPQAPWPCEVWVPGEAAGAVVGGNLCLLAATCGTPAQLDARGAILVLEEIGEPAYKVDRMLQQLVSAGALRGVAGVVVGECVDCRVPEGADYALTDVFLDHLGPLGVPVFGGAPVGHGAHNHAFVWGRAAAMRDGALVWEA